MLRTRVRRLPTRFAASWLALLLLSGAIPHASSHAAGSARSRPAISSRQVSFMDGQDRVYGTLELPASTRKHSLRAALLLPSSGGADRNGNDPGGGLRHINTLRNFAAALARAGVATLRYDKLGVGQTGIGTHDPAAIGFDVDLSEARAAYHFLATWTAVDPHRLMILGHSEGGLVGLVLASHPARVPGLRGLVLAAPPGKPILEQIREEFVAQYARAEQMGLVTPEQAGTVIAELDRIIAQLKSTGMLPAEIQAPDLRAIFRPGVVKFLLQEEQYDPRTLATRAPRALPVLILHGKKDLQISEADVQGVLRAFRGSRHKWVALYELPNVDHVFKEVPGTPKPAIDYNNPALRFSRAAVRRVDAFERRSL